MNEFYHKGLVRLQTGASQKGAAIKFGGFFGAVFMSRLTLSRARCNLINTYLTFEA